MIRKAKSTDIDKIMQIWLEANTKAHAFIAPVYWQKHFDEVKNHYLPQAETFVYEDKHQLKGFISILLDNFVGALFVDTRYQRQNIGTKLLDYARKQKSSLNLKVYALNQPAIKFYQKNDFKILAEKFDDSAQAKELIMGWMKGSKNPFLNKSS